MDTLPPDGPATLTGDPVTLTGEPVGFVGDALAKSLPRPPFREPSYLLLAMDTQGKATCTGGITCLGLGTC